MPRLIAAEPHHWAALLASLEELRDQQFLDHPMSRAERKEAGCWARKDGPQEALPH